ncbi:metal ABC transporter solute-binding protein, Zn/Mn family [Kribbella sp.]|uniref:metal ABC transporter solute-binding protein, Zn/Mn family n=1 Tax=Kribbella sp. TaxID=1871183 RepID=UPI002D455637|nr:zinc ABC transporter substrate-binding protein [Kribbella sp.]HZX02137.1 zinc ABC transporter substrate-binding protein [Kribbella sp.]
MRPVPVPRVRRAARWIAVGVVTVVTAASAAACSTAPTASAGGSSRTIQVVAAENFWGSIASQLGGSRAKVTSIINNPAADPHDYEPTAADARTFAGARYTVVNGIGYDAWASKLLAASAGNDRTDLNVGDLLGIKPGGNPHRWYSPADVHTVIGKITDDYKAIDPADAAYFDQQRTTYEKTTLAPYEKLVAGIKAKYAGTPIGASESIVSPLAEQLGLRMLTPVGFLNAISEGSDPVAADKAAIDQQIATGQIKVYVFNSQNATPDVRAQVAAAKAKGIPVATVTETLTPAGATFQDWQVHQLQAIEQALATAARR